uniref:Uncharacterized protein n=1 Tax=Fagus sylvatica TaxID=28930 RepID=A0A2N9GRU9_FAGSY
MVLFIVITETNIEPSHGLEELKKCVLSWKAVLLLLFSVVFDDVDCGGDPLLSLLCSTGPLFTGFPFEQTKKKKKVAATTSSFWAYLPSPIATDSVPANHISSGVPSPF